MKLGKVVEVEETIALSAAKISVQYQIPMADSLIYASGVINDAIIWTQDKDFENLPNPTLLTWHR